MSARLDKAIFAGLIAAVMFTALAHGAVEPWSAAIFELTIVALVLAWGAKAVMDKRLSIQAPSSALPLAALLVFGFIQSLTLGGSDGRRLSLSMDVEATRASTLGMFFMFVAFIIAANFLSTRDRLGKVALTLTIYGLAMALFALVQRFTWNGRFYWLRQASEGVTSPFGPFANHNHFAGYMEMLMPIPLAMVIARAINRDSRLFHLFAAAMMAIAAVASLSRGGMISLAAEIAFIALMSIQARGHRESGMRRRKKVRVSRRANYGYGFSRSSVPASLHSMAMIALIIAAIAAGVYWTGPERVLNRAAQSGVLGDDPKAETFYASRGWIWRDTLAMISANPITGVGLGAYETAYPRYSAEDVANRTGESYSVDRAHNDYLQALADCGVVGGAIALWFIASLFRAVRRGLRSSDPLLRAFALGGGAGLFGLLTHSLFDFNLQLPSNALLFLLLAGIVSRIGVVVREREAKRVAESFDRVNEFAYVTGVSS
jgi:O-antigen ligase